MSPMEDGIILPAGFSVSDIDWSLYAIIDVEWLQNRPIQDICKQIIRGGAGIVQYRDKVSESGEFYRNAEKIRKITRQNNIPFIINDRVDVAVAVEADGVHLGHRDLPLVIAHRLIKRHMLIGGSVSSLKDLACMENADYIGVGAVFKTDTHKDYAVTGLEILKKVRKKWAGPMVGIGGIDLKNLESVIGTGADGVAVISAILKSGNVENATRNFTDVIRKIKLKKEGLSHG